MESKEYFCPMFMDWNLYDIIKVIPCNPEQIGYDDYPGAPYIFVTVIDKNDFYNDIIKVDWHNLCETLEEADQKGIKMSRLEFY